MIFPEEREQQKLNEVFDEVLGERKVSILIRNFILREEDEKKQLIKMMIYNGDLLFNGILPLDLEVKILKINEGN